MTYSRIIGVGSYLPERVLTNDDLASLVDTTDEWIVGRTGIRERRVAADHEFVSDLAFHASQRALAMAGVDPKTIDLIIVATSTPDMIFPSSACILQSKLGIRNNPAFDMQAVCAGFIYALATANQFVRSGQAKRALVVGAEVFSRILDFRDRTTCVLFGDGAGAVVIEGADAPGILSSHLHADGSYNQVLAVPGSVVSGVVRGNPFVVMEGGAVFKFAVKVLEEVALEALNANGLTTADVDWLIPHQANIRIIEATARKLGLPMNRVVITVEKHGNTSAASVPLALDTAVRDGRIRPGQTVLLEGVGGGFTWGAVLLKF